MMSNYDSLKDQSHYPKLEDNEVSKLLGDRIQFKLWSAKKHLDKLVKTYLIVMKRIIQQVIVFTIYPDIK